jgi:hypothetical protein
MGVPTAIHGNADLVGLAAQNLAELEVAKRTSFIFQIPTLSFVERRGAWGAQSVHSRGMANEPNSEWRKLRLSTPETLLTFRTTNR